MHRAAIAAPRREAMARGVLGRRRELDLILAAVSAGRDVLLEGPPGTSKSTILRGITSSELPIAPAVSAPGEN